MRWPGLRSTAGTSVCMGDGGTASLPRGYTAEKEGARPGGDSWGLEAELTAISDAV